jgi:PHP family Zn ribbon phosphoesterase
MLRRFRSDLHIHTCLSPCADLTMSPKRIVEKATEMQLDIIGITDHNSAENVQAAVSVAQKQRITVLPGMEITSSEEVHIIALFDSVKVALQLQQIVYQRLPTEENNIKLFGEQIIANEYDEVEGYNQRLLITATDMNLRDIVDTIHQLKGLAIAAHVDRESYSIIGQLGFIPDDLEIDAVEISPRMRIDKANQQFPSIQSLPKITSSDAHYLHDIGKVSTTFLIAEPTSFEMQMALRNKTGRKIICESQ